MIDNWGGFVGLLGFLASVGGLAYAFLARRAAKSAEQAAREARLAITRTLSVVDIGQAEALIGRLKDVHHRRNWDYALGLYPELRRMLNDIVASVPDNFAPHGDFINRAVPQVTALENLVGRARYENENGEPEDIPSLDEALTEIQQSLETLRSSIIYADESVSN